MVHRVARIWRGWSTECPASYVFPASYEARAIHYESLYGKPLTYTLIPGGLPPGWMIRVMDTAPALGQPGGSLGLIFLDETGKQVSIDDLIKAGVLG